MSLSSKFCPGSNIIHLICLLPQHKQSSNKLRKKALSRRIFVAANNLTQFGVNAQVRILTKRCIFSSQVTFGETLVIFTIIFLFAMIVAGVYNGNHEMYFNQDNCISIVTMTKIMT